jgi:hypothetical protein
MAARIAASRRARSGGETVSRTVRSGSCGMTVDLRRRRVRRRARAGWGAPQPARCVVEAPEALERFGELLLGREERDAHEALAAGAVLGAGEDLHLLLLEQSTQKSNEARPVRRTSANTKKAPSGRLHGTPCSRSAPSISSRRSR